MTSRHFAIIALVLLLCFIAILVAFGNLWIYDEKISFVLRYVAYACYLTSWFITIPQVVVARWRHKTLNYITFVSLSFFLAVYPITWMVLQQNFC